jgi:hypothetical protein
MIYFRIKIPQNFCIDALRVSANLKSIFVIYFSCPTPSPPTKQTKVNKKITKIVKRTYFNYKSVHMFKKHFLLPLSSCPLQTSWNKMKCMKWNGKYIEKIAINFSLDFFFFLHKKSFLLWIVNGMSGIVHKMTQFLKNKKDYY